MTSSSVEELKQQGNKAFQAGNHARAIELFGQAIAMDPSNAVLYSNRSAAYASLKQYDRALEDAESCIKLRSDWSKGYGRKGAALFGLDKFEEAQAAYADGLKYESDNALLKKGVEDARAAAQSSRGNPLASLFQGDVLAKIAGNPRLAKYLAEPDFVQKVQALSANPSLINMYLQDPRITQTMIALMGLNVQMAGGDGAVPMEEDTAEDAESPALKATSTHAPAKENAPEPEPEPELELSEEERELKQRKDQSKKEKELGNAAYKNRQFEDALVHYGKAWDLDADDITILTNRAAVYFEQGNYDQSIATCEVAVEKGRELRADYKIIAKAYGRAGNAYFKKNDYESAIKFYQKSLTEHRTPDILERLKETEKLKAKLDREAYQNPTIAEEERNKGNELFKEGKFADAISHYTESINRAENDPRGYSNRSACYTKLMAWPEALRDAEKAIELDKTFVKAYLRKAAIQFGMKEYTGCIKTCDEATAMDREHHQSKHQSEIEAQKQKATFGMYGGMTGADDDGLSQEEKLKKAMDDPKVQEILSDPIMRQILEQMSSDPKAAQDHMKNPMIREKIAYLAAKGVIGVR